MARDDLTVYEDTSMERLKAALLGKLAGLAPPWIGIAVLFIAAAVAHNAWGRSPYAVQAAAGIGAATVVVTAALWLLSRARGPVTRIHTAASAALAGGWLAVAILTGPGQPVTGYVLVVGGSVMAVVWDARHLLRRLDEDTGPEGRLSRWFAQVAETAGLGESRMRVRRAGQRKAEGIIVLPPGAKTADDAIKAAGRVESGLKFPPGSLSVAPHEDRADFAKVTISDPRVLRKSQPWPGPSRPGASIAEPIRPGVWQDAEDAAYDITGGAGHHLQVMGQTGSGKSLGACWNYLAEVVTRTDAAVVGIDITKDRQTLGPLEPALHKLITGKDEARSFLAALRAEVPRRTAHLAARGLQKWAQGCGLTFLVVWMEECPDILDALGDKGLDEFVSFLKAARSAGITVVMSLQRSDYTQMPTLARGQLANWCFGVANSADASFGLSEIQDERGARPELWGSRQPGMAYLDAPTIPDDRVAMPMRCWDWGRDDTLISAHAAAYPASGRPIDPLTAALLGAEPLTGTIADQGEPDEDEETPEDVMAEYVTEPVEPGDDVPAGLGDEIEVPDDAFGAWDFSPPPGVKPGPDESRRMFRELLDDWAAAGRDDFAPRDLAPLLERTGLSRAWAHKVLAEACGAGDIEPVEDPERGRFGRYRILAREPA